MDKPYADDTPALISLYSEAIRKSCVSHLYTKRLEGEQVSSPFNLEAWWMYHQTSCKECAHFGNWSDAKAHNQENPCYISDILAILYHGFVIPFRSLPPQRQLDNYVESLETAPATVAKEWQKMVDNGVVLPAQVAPRCVAPSMAIVKERDVEDALAELALRGHRDDLDEDSPGFIDRLNTALKSAGVESEVKARLCADISRTINDSIIQCPFQWHPTDALLEHLGSMYFLCKVDFRRCFYNIPLHPSMYQYMGLFMENKFWHAVRVLFGISLGPFVASILTGESTRFFRAAGVPCEVYIDDVAAAGETEEACYANRAMVLTIALALGWPISMDKLEEDKPATRLAYRGVVFDTVEGTLSIPVSRLATTLRLVSEALAAPERVRVRKLRSVLGRLEWVSQVLPLGRIHTKRIYADIPRGAKNNWLVPKLSDSSLGHLQWWRTFLESNIAGGGAQKWAGFDRPLSMCPTVRMFSDSSGEIGFGAIGPASLVAGLWSSAEAVSDRSSSWKEWVPILLLFRRLAPRLTPGTVVVVTTDNEANAFSLNNGSAGEESFDLVAEILVLADQFNLRLVADWVPREFNELSDALSRLSPLPGHSSAAPPSHPHSQGWAGTSAPSCT